MRLHLHHFIPSVVRLLGTGGTTGDQYPFMSRDIDYRHCLLSVTLGSKENRSP